VTRPKRRWLVVLLVAVLALVTGGGLAFAFPSVAAITCPRCYGLTAIADGLYTERGRPEADRQRLIQLYGDASRRVSDFYGGRESSPRVLACFTSGCYERIGGGGERGIAVLNRAVMLAPRGIDPVIVAHEFSHVELHERLGGRRAEVPQWFDEGLAVLVSDDSRYLLPSTATDRCRVTSDERLPETLDAWLSAAGADEQIYAKAACRVSRWADRHGGPRAVLDLIDSLNRGEPFTAAVSD
jgi:hypothetical protein